MSVDEGIAVIQARALADGTWTIDYPLHAIDPDGSAFPLRSAEPGGGGWVPYGKHPLYPALLSIAERLGGTVALIGLSIGGTAIAALAAATLARRLAPSLVLPCLYVVGLASPLLFDSSLIMAHAAAAAAVGIAAVSILRHLDAPERWLSPWLALALVALIAVVMLRGEGLLLVAALGAVSCVVALRTRLPAWWTTSVLTVVGIGVALTIERTWRNTIYGASTAMAGTSASSGLAHAANVDAASLISDRAQGLLTTTLKPGYDGARADILLLGMASFLLVALIAMRRGAGEERTAAAFSVVGAALGFAWFVIAPASPVPGILLAFPLLWIGLGAGQLWAVPLSRVLVSVSVPFALAVMATQYRQGGGLEWGARYLAIVLPLVVPIALLGLWTRWRTIGDRRLGLAAGGSLLVVSIVLGGMALRSQRHTNHAVAKFRERITDVVMPSALGADDTDRRPVVVSADFILPQVTWSIYDDYRWMRLRDDEPIDVNGPDERVRALIEAGIDGFTFITPDLSRDRPLLGDGVVLGPDLGLDGWSVVRVTPIGPAH